jgi:hypothetical protein
MYSVERERQTEREVVAEQNTYSVRPYQGKLKVKYLCTSAGHPASSSAGPYYIQYRDRTRPDSES